MERREILEIGRVKSFSDGVFAIAAILLAFSAGQWAYAARNPHVLAAHASKSEMWTWFRVACVAPAVFLFSIAVASVSVTWAMRSWGLMLVFLPLARRVLRR